jgi:hypothetical protein
MLPSCSGLLLATIEAHRDSSSLARVRVPSRQAAETGPPTCSISRLPKKGGRRGGRFVDDVARAGRWMGEGIAESLLAVLLPEEPGQVRRLRSFQQELAELMRPSSTPRLADLVDRPW